MSIISIASVVDTCLYNFFYIDLSSEQVDQLLDIIEEKLMEHMYTTLFNQISSEYEEKDLALQNRIRSLNWITAQRLGLEIKENSPEIRELIDKAITGKCYPVLV